MLARVVQDPQESMQHLVLQSTSPTSVWTPAQHLLPSCTSQQLQLPHIMPQPDGHMQVCPCLISNSSHKHTVGSQPHPGRVCSPWLTLQHKLCSQCEQQPHNFSCTLQLLLPHTKPQPNTGGALAALRPKPRMGNSRPVGLSP